MTMQRDATRRPLEHPVLVADRTAFNRRLLDKRNFHTPLESAANYRLIDFPGPNEHSLTRTAALCWEAKRTDGKNRQEVNNRLS